MLIGILSDSHDHIENTQKAVQLFKDRACEMVVHAGDLCFPGMVELFAGLNWHMILGNNEGELLGLMKKFEEHGGKMHGEFFAFEQDSLKIAVYHGTIKPLRDALIDWGKYDVVIYGHDHVKRVERVGNTLVINPGTVHGYGAEKPTVALLNTMTKEVKIEEL